MGISEFLEELRKNARERHIPVMRTQTAKLLEDCVKEIKPKLSLEIGTSIGTSAINLLNNCDGKLTTIEIDEDIQNLAKQNILKVKFSDRCDFILGDCHNIVDMMCDNRYDFIILDGPKGHYLELYEMLVPMLNKNGTLFVDDVGFYNLVNTDDTPKRKHRTIVVNLRKLIKRAKQDTRVETKIYDFEDGVLVAKKVL